MTMVVFSNEVCSTFTAMSSRTLLSDHVCLPGTHKDNFNLFEKRQNCKSSSQSAVVIIYKKAKTLSQISRNVILSISRQIFIKQCTCTVCMYRELIGTISLDILDTAEKKWSMMRQYIHHLQTSTEL